MVLSHLLVVVTNAQSWSAVAAVQQIHHQHTRRETRPQAMRVRICWIPGAVGWLVGVFLEALTTECQHKMSSKKVGWEVDAILVLLFAKPIALGCGSKHLGSDTMSSAQKKHQVKHQ